MGKLSSGGKVFQPLRGSGGNWNSRVTVAYVIYWWVTCTFVLCDLLCSCFVRGAAEVRRMVQQPS